MNDHAVSGCVLLEDLSVEGGNAAAVTSNFDFLKTLCSLS